MTPADSVIRALQIYRNFEFGKLMKLVMLDTRIIGEKVCSTCALFELQLHLWCAWSLNSSLLPNLPR